MNSSNETRYGDGKIMSQLLLLLAAAAVHDVAAVARF